MYTSQINDMGDTCAGMRKAKNPGPDKNRFAKICDRGLFEDTVKEVKRMARSDLERLMDGEQLEQGEEKGEDSLQSLVAAFQEHFDVKTLKEMRRRAVEYFENSCSHMTHGDGMFHDQAFWTYGSCECDTCCAYAVMYGELYPRYKRRKINQNIVDVILDYFQMQQILDYIKKADGGLAEILGGRR